MAQIAWTTPAGNLGTYTELQEFSLQLEAENPLNTDLIYTVVSGSLPPGIQLYRSGLLYGIPNITDAGEPVARKFKFTIRATNSANQIADRTFTMAVNGILPPTLNTTTESLGSFFDSDYINLRLLYTETNPGTSLEWTISNGQLPPGLRLTSAGEIIGFAEAPPAGGPAGTASWDQGRYDEFVWDFEGATLSRTYNFAVRIFDGILSAERYYNITIVAKSFFRTDNALISADTSLFTADRDGYQYPTITTLPSELVPVRADRAYAFQFQVYYPNPNVPVYWRLAGSGPAVFDQGALPNPDDNGNSYETSPYDEKSFDQSNLAVPPGLFIDKETGWLTGTIGLVTARKTTYTFKVVAYVEIPVSATVVSVRESTPVTYTLDILADIDDFIIWETSSDLGVLDNGDVSTIYISATGNRGEALTYSLKSGQYSRLPQGLSLLPSGRIAGRTTFDFYSMDRGSYPIIMDNGTTTWDSQYTFTVLAQDATGFVFDTKEFTITIRNVNIRPFENLYLKALLPLSLRERFRTTIYNSNLVTEDMVYRPDDPNFGLAKEIKFLAVPGVRASKLSDYITAMDLYHSNRKVTFSGLKLAIAKDQNLNIKYEVIYIEVQDYNTVANETASTNLSRASGLRIIDGGDLSGSNSSIDYGDLNSGISNAFEYGRVSDAVENSNQSISLSNSFGNMTSEIVNHIGYEYQGAIPDWMTTVQPETGQPIGFVKAVVLAYLNPGEGKKLLFRYTADLTSSGFGITALLNQYAFEIDRYQVDKALTINYDPDTEKFTKTRTTTFDRIPSIGLVDYGPWEQKVSGTTNTLRSVDYHNGEFIAVGDAATIIKSRSGEIWTPVSQIIDLSYRAGVLVAAPVGATEFSFAYGTNFSLGDEILNEGTYEATVNSYITDINYFTKLTQPTVGSIPSGAAIEFTTFDGTTFSLQTDSVTANAASSLFFANISSVERGYSIAIKGIDTANRANVLINNTVTNTVRLSKNLTSTVPAGSSVTFDDLAGTTTTLITSASAASGQPNLTFTTSTVSIVLGSYARMSNIAPGTYIQTLNTNVTVTEPTTNALPIGTDLYFNSVITADAYAGDSHINLSSTERIGIGSVVSGDATAVRSALTMPTWSALPTGGTVLNVTVPTDALGSFTPFVGMYVNGYSLPVNSEITGVVAQSANTVISLRFANTIVKGNPVTKTKASTGRAEFDTDHTFLDLSPNVATDIRIGDYVTSTNIALTDGVRVSAIYSNLVIRIEPTVSTHHIDNGETVSFMTPLALDFTAPSIVPAGTVVTAKTATSVTLSSPLQSNVFIGADATVNFGLGETQLNYVTYAGSSWYAVGTKSTVLERNADGVWSQQYALPYGDLYSIAYNSTAPAWIIVGNEGLVATSTDFSSWTRLNLGISASLRSIEYYNGLFVAVGDSGTIIYSDDDGATWNINNSVTTNNLNMIKYINGQWIAVGAKGTVLLSQDGQDWTAYNAGTKYTLRDVARSNNLYMAVGDRGIVVESTDGEVWEVRLSNQNANIYSIADNPLDPVAVGDAGLVLVEANNFVVDWAVRGVSFEMFNNNSLAQLAALGYPIQVGETLIFADQEGFDPTKYRGDVFENDGWNQYTQIYDSANGSTYDSNPFDSFSVVPGFLENQLDTAVSNQRAGVWTIALNSNDIAYLVFVRQIQLNQIVTVRNEVSKLVYDPQIAPGNSVPGFRRLHSQINSSTEATVFDTNSTRFSNPRDQYLSDPTVYDKYLKFPNTGLLQ